MTTDFPPLVSILQQILDPRRTQGRRYSLPVLLAWMSVATMCGYTSYSSMTEWTSHYGSSLLRVIGFTGDRVPCKGWLSRLLRRLDVEALEARLNEWAEAVLAWLPPSDATEEAFSADGKALRGSRKQGLRAPISCRSWASGWIWFSTNAPCLRTPTFVRTRYRCWRNSCGVC